MFAQRTATDAAPGDAVAPVDVLPAVESVGDPIPPAENEGVRYTPGRPTATSGERESEGIHKSPGMNPPDRTAPREGEREEGGVREGVGGHPAVSYVSSRNECEFINE
jgi:hypothetical protein